MRKRLYFLTSMLTWDFLLSGKSQENVAFSELLSCSIDAQESTMMTRRLKLLDNILRCSLEKSQEHVLRIGSKESQEHT